MTLHARLFVGFLLLATALSATLPTGFQRDGDTWTLPWGDSPLQGILIEPTGPADGPRPAVLLSHGLGGSAANQRQRAQQFADAGYVAIAVDYAHAGPGQMRNPDNAASPENIRRAKACFDILAALPDVAPERRYAWGFSMGAILTCGLVAEHPDLVAAAAIMAGGIQENPERLYISADQARHIRTPMLILHGENDGRVLPEWSALLAEVLTEVGTPYERYTYPGVNHPGILREADASDRILPWFARFPAPASATTSATSARPRAAPEPDAPMPGESRLIPRDGIDYLTYESEAGFAELERLLATDATTPLTPGEYQMRYFRSAVDGSVQPYGLWVPAGYDPSQSYNLLIQLHGIGPKTLADRRQTWTGQGVTAWIDTEDPTVVIHPFGRGNSFYQGIGEADVLEAIADTRRRVSIPDNRVFMMGHSMGGAGAWMVGLHYPDRFGSITPIDAAMGFDDELSNPTALPAWMRPQTVMFGQENLFPNARNVLVYLKNAGAGIQTDSTVFMDGVVAAGGFATTEFFPGKGHYWARELSHAMFTAQATQVPTPTAPPEVKFMTNTLRYHRAYWVDIDQLSAPATVATITATYDDGIPPPLPPAARRRGRQPPPPTPPTLSITTANIAALTLRLADAGIPADAMPALAIDNTVMPAEQLSATVHLTRDAGGAWSTVSDPAISFGAKRPGLQGPVGDAFTRPFLAVYGDAPSDRELAIAELDAVRNPPTRLVIHGEFPLKPASAVTPEDIATKNLILFGSVGSHPLLRRYADQLPGELLSGDTVFIQPNPESPDHYIVVWQTAVLSRQDLSLRAGYIQPVNLLPDFIRVQDDGIVEAGHFTNQWTLPQP